jgi:hypothetical protein
VLVQSGLYPHAGYDGRVKLLAPHSLDNPWHRGAIVLLAERASPYPFEACGASGIGQTPRVNCPLCSSSRPFPPRPVREAFAET